MIVSGPHVHSRPSPNCDSRDGVAVDMLVLHYTGMESRDAALERLCDPAAEVSAHWVIDEDGTLYALVAEELRAWHAGRACWRGQSNINARSVGIELVNGGHDFGSPAYPDAQIFSLIELARDIIGWFAIPVSGIVGHSCVAPTRKQDPGERFPWKRLAAAGIGYFPHAGVGDSPSATDAKRMIAEVGYDLSDEKAGLMAFQRRYRPAGVDGILDAETAALAADLHTRLTSGGPV